MERELWNWISRAITNLARTHTANAYHDHGHDVIVRVYLWSVLHDRPVSWACKPEHWDYRTRPQTLPSQPTVSRRLRTRPIQDMIAAVCKSLSPCCGLGLLKFMDGKALTIPMHSKDPDATYGPVNRKPARGYKLHAIWGENAMPDAWTLRPLNHNEKTVAHDLIPQVTGPGYLLADGFYQSNALFERAADHGRQLYCPRPKKFWGKPIRQPKRFHPARLRSIAGLESDPSISQYARRLFSKRKRIEQKFGNLTGFGGGLTCLPPWVRRLHRVRLYVHAKLLINAARIRCIHA